MNRKPHSSLGADARVVDAAGGAGSIHEYVECLFRLRRDAVSFVRQPKSPGPICAEFWGAQKHSKCNPAPIGISPHMKWNCECRKRRQRFPNAKALRFQADISQRA